MVSRRVFGTIVVGSVVLSAAGGAGAAMPGGDDEPVTIEYWTFEEGGLGAFQETVRDAFEATYPNIQVEITSFPEDQYDVKIDTAIAAGEEPDLILVFGPDRMREGQLLPLDGFVADKGIDLSTFNRAIIEGPSTWACSWEGELFCLGSYLGITAMFYNKQLFDAAGVTHPDPWPPMTLEEYADIACQLRDEDAGVWGTAFGTSFNFLPTDLVVSPDGRTVEGIMNSPETIEQYDLLTGIVREGCAPTENIIDPWEQGTDFFVQGQLATVVTDWQSLAEIEAAGIDYGTTAVPSPTGVEPFFFVWTDSVGVLERSDHPAEAMEFVGFLATEGQRLRAEVRGDLPLSIAVAEELDWAQGIPGRVDGLEIASHARPDIFVPGYPWGPLDEAIALMSGGERSAEDALNDAAGQAQDELDELWEDWEE
jgi:multiple sugar transport system substrate-binding protein